MGRARHQEYPAVERAARSAHELFKFGSAFPFFGSAGALRSPVLPLAREDPFLQQRRAPRGVGCSGNLSTRGLAVPAEERRRDSFQTPAVSLVWNLGLDSVGRCNGSHGSFTLGSLGILGRFAYLHFRQVYRRAKNSFSSRRDSGDLGGIPERGHQRARGYDAQFFHDPYPVDLLSALPGFSTRASVDLCFLFPARFKRPRQGAGWPHSPGNDHSHFSELEKEVGIPVSALFS